MSITAETYDKDRHGNQSCTGCGGKKAAPIAALVHFIPNYDLGTGTGVTVVLCEECGRDAANAIGFMCIREGGWSKLEPRKRKAKS